jgi:DNA-binding Lrp family transcriptional regulator
MTLDRIDFEILAALQNNARLSNKEIAAKVDLAPSTCLGRIRALTKSGAVKGYHCDVSPAVLGIGLEALVAIRLVKHSKEAFRALYSHLMSMPEVLSVFHVSGANDLQVHVAVRDVYHLRDLIVDKFATRSEIDHCETSVIYDSHRKYVLPRYFAEGWPLDGKQRKSASRRRSRVKG